MPTLRLLFLDATSLAAYRWHGGHLDREAEFAPDQAGLEAFASYVSSARSSQFHLLADVAEESFQLEDTPFVSGSDRAALIKRKLAQFFYETPYALALSLGRKSEGRRDERMLFTALTRPQQVEPWLDAIHQADGQLAGLHSLPLVSAALPSLLAVTAQRFLLISITRGGLRQTLFENGKVMYSRLTLLATRSITEMALACAAEAQKMHQYMAGQRLILRGSQLTTLVLVHPAQMSAFRETCKDTGAVHFEFVDLLALAGQVGLKSLPADTHCDNLFLHLLARRPPREQFAPEADRHLFRLGQLRFALRAMGFLIFSGCLLASARLAIESRDMDKNSVLVAAQTASDRQRYNTMLQTLPKIPLTNDDLRALISRYDTLQKKSVGPEPIYGAISQALLESPRVELKRLAWSLGAGKDGRGTKTSAPALATSVPAAVAPETTFESIQIQAALPFGLVSDHRAQLAAIENFTEHLRSRKLQVQTLSLPFESESSKSLKSSSDSVSQVQAPQFSLRVTRSAP